MKTRQDAKPLNLDYLIPDRIRWHTFALAAIVRGEEMQRPREDE